MIDEKQYKLTKEDALQIYNEAVKANPGADKKAIVQDARRRIEERQHELDEAYKSALYAQIVDDAE